MEGQLLRIEYVRLDRVLLWERNPKEHDLGAIARSIRRYGFRDALIYDAALNDGKGGIAAGNGRASALLAMMRENGSAPPVGIGLDVSDGMWAVPVQFGIDSADQAAAEAFALDHNSLVMAGGEFTALDMSRMYDEQVYLQLLKSLDADDEMPVTVDGDDLQLLTDMLDRMNELPEFKEYDESVENEVKWLKCPKCGHQWPK